jgi:hypothetical protein
MAWSKVKLVRVWSLAFEGHPFLIKAASVVLGLKEFVRQRADPIHYLLIF